MRPAGGLLLWHLGGDLTPVPVLTCTTAEDLPAGIPAAPARALTELGPMHRPPTLCLWEAITAAVLRQVVRAARVLTLYARWGNTYGEAVNHRGWGAGHGPRSAGGPVPVRECLRRGRGRASTGPRRPLARLPRRRGRSVRCR